MSNEASRARHPGAERFIPDTDDLAEMAEAARECRGCDLYRGATQTVFGNGAERARVLMLGEQPGDQEDRQGEPFVGPAGAILRRALVDAGVAERSVYLTNAVKHFRWRRDESRGKRRIHQRPDAGQVAACRPWWLAEVRAVRPEILVALGATAGQALFGSSFRVGSTRGAMLEWQEPGGRTIPVLATIHPSAVLRATDREVAYAGFVGDMRKLAKLLKQ
ncbi:UdgX family uracil-DNA binding protein [Actinospica sp. MGRD01-02]|uniref:Type-4 uracil-DNA glycosylase n=1 Tax=Actinospica acidithermotolerans TaxID=2828514 RepID=A0A941EEU2_9ACTN|nr:UdgX family uracil-DNA binding protein [Actinospica acidithermotolerans]MBR7829113.1 UdgX family uracil-DNA binding protein [Actinospica acidithermotolerans]